MMRFAAICLLVSGVPATATSPIAEVICDSREILVQKLERSFGAVPQGRGLRGPETVMEIWTVPSTGEWTMVQSYASGQACIVAMGEDWDVLQAPADPA